MSFLSKDIPGDLAALVQKGSRLIDWAPSTTGFVGVTLENLIVVDSQSGFTIPWSKTIRAQWTPPILTVTVEKPTGAEMTDISWSLPVAGRVPELVRDRITSVVVIDHIRVIPDVGRVRFVARRIGRDIQWSAFTDQDLSSEQQELVALTKEQVISHFGI